MDDTTAKLEDNVNGTEKYYDAELIDLVKKTEGIKSKSGQLIRLENITDLETYESEKQNEYLHHQSSDMDHKLDEIAKASLKFKSDLSNAFGDPKDSYNGLDRMIVGFIGVGQKVFPAFGEGVVGRINESAGKRRYNSVISEVGYHRNEAVRLLSDVSRQLEDYSSDLDGLESQIMQFGNRAEEYNSSITQAETILSDLKDQYSKAIEDGDNPKVLTLAKELKDLRSDVGQFSRNRQIYSIKVASIDNRIAQKIVRATSASELRDVYETIVDNASLTYEVLNDAKEDFESGSPIVQEQVIRYDRTMQNNLDAVGKLSSSIFEATSKIRGIATNTHRAGYPAEGIQKATASQIDVGYRNNEAYLEMQKILERHKKERFGM